MVLEIHVRELWLIILNDTVYTEVRVPGYRVGDYSCDNTVISHEDRSDRVEHVARVWICRVEKGTVVLAVI